MAAREKERETSARSRGSKCECSIDKTLLADDDRRRLCDGLVRVTGSSNMLDHFAILCVLRESRSSADPRVDPTLRCSTQGGLVLWQRSFTPAPAPFDALIREALIEQRTSSSSSADSAQVSRWDKDAHSVLWLLANDLDLVFCVAYQRILALPYVPDLLHAVRTAFLDRYGDAVRNIVDSTSGKAIASSSEPWNRGFKGWDDTFNRILREHEASSAKVRSACPLPCSVSARPDLDFFFFPFAKRSERAAGLPPSPKRKRIHLPRLRLPPPAKRPVAFRVSALPTRLERKKHPLTDAFFHSTSTS